MSITSIPEKTKVFLWIRAGGRCEFEGCNEALWQEKLTLADMNKSYIAHIIADQPGGPRGDAMLSGKLKADPSNLMLLCDEHHRLIDAKENIAKYPVELLGEMKRKHEQRIELLTSIKTDKNSHILLYGANIGQQSAKVNWDQATNAMSPKWYPASKPAIEISLSNSTFQDDEKAFWDTERVNLTRHFEHQVKPRLASGEISHLSVFAIAPQPLLIQLGALLSDIPAAQVYQLHREPPTWSWYEHAADAAFTIIRPEQVKPKIALNLSLSAAIDGARITKVLGDDVSIWTITHPNPNNDFLKSEKHLSEFRVVFRQFLDQIKKDYGYGIPLHIFPAVPVSVAVEIGRVRMPKADLPFVIYDENRKLGGFKEALTIGDMGK